MVAWRLGEPGGALARRWSNRATVVCTGRSGVVGADGSDYSRAETVEKTAELVTRIGGLHSKSTTSSRTRYG